MRVAGILESCLYVDDLDAAQKFYIDILGLQLVERHPTRHVFLRCGAHMLLIFQPESSNVAGSSVPRHGATGPGHIAFAVADDEFPRWITHLHAHEIAVEKTVDWPQGGHSVYFRDPAGNSLELASPRIWRTEES